MIVSTEQNAEVQRHRDAEIIHENKITDRIIAAAIEVKATEKINEVHSAQVLTYLRLTNCKVGLVLNFGQTLLRNGISRIVNNL